MANGNEEDGVGIREVDPRRDDYRHKLPEDTVTGNLVDRVRLLEKALLAEQEHPYSRINQDQRIELVERRCAELEGLLEKAGMRRRPEPPMSPSEALSLWGDDEVAELIKQDPNMLARFATLVAENLRRRGEDGLADKIQAHLAEKTHV